jgi:hypothetical protein
VKLERLAFCLLQFSKSASPLSYLSVVAIALVRINLYQYLLTVISITESVSVHDDAKLVSSLLLLRALSLVNRMILSWAFKLID